ncbi:MAG: hypothetical protein ACOY3Y_05920 [Acidobacteriota bacterium]
MSSYAVLFGDQQERFEAERVLKERFADLSVESHARPWEFVERACQVRADVAIVLRGPISEHQQRIDAVTSLRRHGFGGRILYAGAFLTEKHDAVAAGADYVLDPDRQVLENVVAAAIQRPRLAADHPYLRYLFVGEWAAVEAFGDLLPPEPPAVLAVAMSQHRDEAFYSSLAGYLRANPRVNAILVEDDVDEDVSAIALGAGVPNHVVVAQEGLSRVAELGRQLLRADWFARVSAA